MAAGKRSTTRRRKASRPSMFPPPFPPCPTCGSTSRQVHEGVIQPCSCTRRRAKKSRKARQVPTVAEVLLRSAQDAAKDISGLPAQYQASAIELLREIITRDGVLPADFIQRLEEISIEGADPDWQAAELRKIIDELKRRH